MKPTRYYLKSLRPNGPVFEILSYDPDTKEGWLIGPLGRKFREDLSKDRLKKYGYRLMTGEQLEAANGESEELQA